MNTIEQTEIALPQDSHCASGIGTVIRGLICGAWVSFGVWSLGVTIAHLCVNIAAGVNGLCGAG